MTESPIRTQQFTVAAANRALPLIKAIVSDIVELHHDVREREKRLKMLRRKRRAVETHENDFYAEELDQVQSDLVTDTEKLKGFVDELERLGVELRDYEFGLVDFPTVMNGDPAFLSWQLGEPSVGTWHSTATGHQERSPLPTIEPTPFQN